MWCKVVFSLTSFVISSIFLLKLNFVRQKTRFTTNYLGQSGPFVLNSAKPVRVYVDYTYVWLKFKKKLRFASFAVHVSIFYVHVHVVNFCGTQTFHDGSSFNFKHLSRVFSLADFAKPEVLIQVRSEAVSPRSRRRKCKTKSVITSALIRKCLLGKYVKSTSCI